LDEYYELNHEEVIRQYSPNTHKWH